MGVDGKEGGGTLPAGQLRAGDVGCIGYTVRYVNTLCALGLMLGPDHLVQTISSSLKLRP